MSGRRLVYGVLAPCVVALFAASHGTLRAQAELPPPDVDTFFLAASLDEGAAAAARNRIAAHWQEGDAALLVDLLDLLRRTSLVNPASWIGLSRLAQFLDEQTGQSFGIEVDRWHQWLWGRPARPSPLYPAFKARLFGQLDPRFEQFFAAPFKSSIRLDEVQWGGVAVNGIPPLDHPAHVAAADASYLAETDVIFGISVSGDARAYPQRILAWHELARDEIGGRELTIVYCTLCGTVIPYDSRVGGRLRTFGTSGLLYQSNKLMFDEETRSLWSSLDGTPVIGQLVGTSLRLSMLPVVTTTWGEWRRTHPGTTVLSLDTGHRRDYSEGAAYRSYFASDGLMFGVSRMDGRLRNKAEVLALRLTRPDAAALPVAIAADFLATRPVYHLDIAEPPLLVVSSPGGANRVYQSGSHRFTRLDSSGRLIDADGRAWRVGEDELQAAFDPSLELPRVPAHRAFWFGWYAQYPDTLLVK